MPILKHRRATTTQRVLNPLDEPSDQGDAAELATAYAAAYERRAAKGDRGQAFTAPEQNALAAYFAVARHVCISKKSGGERALTQVDALTAAIVEQSRHHSVATDIAGVAWARAFGSLPLPAPAQARLAVVLESGSARGAITGMYASGWRTLFLLEAVSQLDWQSRTLGDQQLARWRRYFSEKVAAAAAEAHPVADAAAAGQTARLAFITGAVGLVARDATLVEQARTLLARVPSDDSDGCPAVSGTPLPTAHCAQLALAAHVTGDLSRRDAVVGHLLLHRRQESSLLAATSDVGGRAELSPWAPLAIVVALGDLAEKATQRQLLFGHTS